MKIEVSSAVPGVVLFEDIRAGEVFQLAEDEFETVYFKTQSCRHDYHNAVTLKTGKLVHWDRQRRVRKATQAELSVTFERK